MRYVILSIGGCIIVAMIAALIGGYIVRADRFGARIAGVLEQETGGDVSLAPQIEMRFMPRLRLILHDVSVDLPRAAQKSRRFTIERLYISIAVWDFVIRRQLTIRAIRAEGVAGDIIWDELTEFGFLRLDTYPINLHDSRFRFHPPGNIAPFMLDDVSGRLRLGVPFEANLRARIDEQNWTFTAQLAAVRIAKHRRTPLRFSATGENAERIDFVGFHHARADERPLAPLIDGVITMRIPQGLAILLAPLGLAPQNAGDVGLALQGAVRINPLSIRADRLRVQALSNPLALRLDIGWQQDANAQNDAMNIIAQLEGDILDLDRLRTVAPRAHEAWHDIFTKNKSVIDVNIDRVVRNGQVMSNAAMRLDYGNNQLKIQRLSADLPFDSTILSSGRLYWEAGMPVFSGEIAMRSGRFVPSFLWASETLGVALPYGAHLRAHAKALRGSFTTNLHLSASALRLDDFRARLDGHDYALDLSLEYMPSKESEARMRIGKLHLRSQRLDLEDWGLLAVGDLPQAPRNIETLPLGAWLKASLASDFVHSHHIEFDIATDNLFAGAISFGALTLKAKVDDGRLRLDELHVSSYETADLNLSGDLAHDGTHVYGRADLVLDAQNGQSLLRPLARLSAPAVLNFDMPVRLRTSFNLSAPDEPDWPSIALRGRGILGDDMELQFNVAAPVRNFDPESSSLNASLRLEGRADAVARLLSLPPPAPRDADAPGRWQFDIARSGQEQGGNVGVFNTRLLLGTQRFDYSGTARSNSDGRVFDGRLDAAGSNIGYFVQQDGVFPYQLETQFFWSADEMGFSDLSLQLVSGRVSGEGVLVRAHVLPQARNQLTANITLADFTLPADFFAAATGDASLPPMRWNMLGLGDARISMALRDVHFRGRTIADMRTRLKLIEGVLEFDISPFTLMEGTARLEGQFEGGTLSPAFQLAGDFNNLDMAQLSDFIYGRRLLAGRGRGDFTLRGRGDSRAAMLRALMGSGQVEMDSGALRFIDFATLTRRENRRIDIRNYIYAPSLATPVTAFSGLLAKFQIRNGIIDIEQGEIVDTQTSNLPPRLLANFAARMSVPKQSLDGWARFFVPNHADPLDLLLSGGILNPQLVK